MRIKLFNSTMSKSLVNSMTGIYHSKNAKQNRYIMESCLKLGERLQMPTSRLLNLTKDSDMKRFSLLKDMVNKTVSMDSQTIEENAEHIINIFKMVKKPAPAHYTIISKTKDSFESIEKIFSLAKDEKSLEFVETLQYDILKNNKNSSKVIIDLLSSKNSAKYIKKIGSYASYLKLHAGEENAVAKLDELVDTGRFSRFHSDAELAIKNLMKKKAVSVAMAGKTTTLEQSYTKDRGNFLQSVVNNFISRRNTPSDKTKNVVVDMYKSLDTKNMKLRQAIMDRFKYNRAQDKEAELREMQILFDRIDSNEYAQKFVQKAMNKDLAVKSIAELNEVLDVIPLKKANVFFNNAKRIIELSSGEERKTALISEIENPFFVPQQRAKIVRMFAHSYENEGLILKAAKIIENQFNRFRYYHSAA